MQLQTPNFQRFNAKVDLLSDTTKLATKLATKLEDNFQIPKNTQSCHFSGTHLNFLDPVDLS